MYLVEPTNYLPNVADGAAARISGRRLADGNTLVGPGLEVRIELGSQCIKQNQKILSTVFRITFGAHRKNRRKIYNCIAALRVITTTFGRPRRGA